MDEQRPDPAAPPASSSTSEPELEPMGRDKRFLYRLIAALVVGVIAAAFVGWKAKGFAANCGSGLVRPGTSVIPSGQPASSQPAQ